MLDIPKTFFNEEIRDGFCVSELMKRSWASQLEILDAIKQLCTKYSLRYYADYGTLLGAVRHKGYIPWDDDLDIAMPRKDFMILLDHAEEIRDGLVIRSFYNTETYMNFNIVVTQKVDMLEWDDKRMRDYHGCPFITYVDIFPWDNVTRDETVLKVQTGMFELAYKLMYDLRNIEHMMFGDRLVSLGELCQPNYMRIRQVQELVDGCGELRGLLREQFNGQVTINNDERLRQQLCIAADTIAKMCPEEDADYVEYFPYFVGDKVLKARKKKEWVETTIELPFEFSSISVPKEYVKVLETKYGEDYMIPRKFLSSHAYPFYRNEVTVLIGGDTGEMLTDTPLKDPSASSIPVDVRQRLLKENGELKQIVLYGLSATDILNRGKPGLEQVESYLDEVEKKTNVIVFIFAPMGLRAFMTRCSLDMYQDYCELVDRIVVMENVIFDEKPSTDMLWALISICDEYYGDKCRLAEICEKYEVPVEIRG
ncbi:LicD family protein [Butyrivibrio fibrisolvens]|uniref:LicD family protein n=1 Tax=Butyrivibrio fibrisolvens TaxID=831 RepID=UPI0003FD13A0|nr:LicD family protein [Butyrivibrio fibrisolvens]